jgi:hypothetical protein
MRVQEHMRLQSGGGAFTIVRTAEHAEKFAEGTSAAY